MNFKIGDVVRAKPHHEGGITFYGSEIGIVVVYHRSFDDRIGVDWKQSIHMINDRARCLHTCGRAISTETGYYVYDHNIELAGPKIRKKTGFGKFLERVEVT